MDAAKLIAVARARAGLSLRELAEAAGTSHATLSAYERGRKVPNTGTLDRVLRATGHSAAVVIGPRVFSGPARERELLDVLELAALFPARHDPQLRSPVFRGRS